MTTLSQAFEINASSHQITKPLDFNSLDGVPESHSWSQPDEPQQKIQTQEPSQEVLIPVIDLTDPNAFDLIGQACKTWGIFQVINHGVPLALIEKLEFESQRLFALPTDEKHKVLKTGNRVTGYGTARISQFFGKSMWYEGFTIMGSCDEHAKVLWPHDYKNFCDTMDAYQNEMKLLTHKLLHIMLPTLNVTQEEMNWAICTQDSQAALQLNSYPSCPNPSNAIGLAPHTDPLLLTLLHQGGVNGLEIFVEGVGWSPVNPVDGALVVNIGDLLHILSNATFQPVYHRATVNQTKNRISVAYFHRPPVESVVAPSSSFENPCFKSMLVKDFISLKNKNFHKVLSMIRK